MEPSGFLQVPSSRIRGAAWVRGKAPGFVAAGAILVGVALLAGSPTKSLQAAPPPVPPLDSDGDGMRDGLEVEFGTDPGVVDSDSDGLGDFEEFLRKSDPLETGSKPGAGAALRVFCYPCPDAASFPPSAPDYRVGVGAYLPTGNLAQLTSLQFAISKDLDLLNVAGVPLIETQGINLTPGAAAGSLLVEFSFALPSAAVTGLAPFTIGAAALLDGIVHVDSAYIDKAGGVPGVYEFVTTQNGASAAFRPLDPQGLPASWGNFGQVCVSSMQSVGSSGPYVLAEVTSSFCEPFPAYCDASACSSQTGTVHLILDLLGLIGDG